jgi:hypothetical protein
MAETTKLSVGKALDKLRGADEPASRMTRLEEEIQTLNRETQRLRTIRGSVERSQRVGNDAEVRAANIGRFAKQKSAMLIIAVVIGSAVLAGTCWSLWR